MRVGLGFVCVSFGLGTRGCCWEGLWLTLSRLGWFGAELCWVSFRDVVVRVLG